MNAAAVAQHLNIAESAIVRIEEWANVLFVVCRKLGARFVSKKVMGINNEKLSELGSEWKKGDKHRIYFNDLAAWYGLETSHYKTGSISGAKLKGELVSNSEAKRISSKFSYVKLWFDVPTQKFMMQRDEVHGASHEMIKTVIEAIKAAVK